jgi:hypothetical protein
MRADTFEIIRSLIETSDLEWSTLPVADRLRLTRTAIEIKEDRKQWARDQARLARIYKKHKLL